MTSSARDSEPGADAIVERLISDAVLELIPLKGADEKLRVVDPGTTITITCSPKFGLDRTLSYVASATERGYRVVPHLAARMVADEAALRRFVSAAVDRGVDDLFVVGGDGEEPVGRFSSASQLLDALSLFDHGLRRIGVGCYPEGHPRIADAVLLDALRTKQVHADYMVSQLCFDADTLLGWIESVRASDVTLPLRIGVAAPIKTARLAELALRIGVGQSLRYLTKQHGMVGSLLLGRSYNPKNLLQPIARQVATGDLEIEGLHVFSFNQLDVTVNWQRRAISASAARP